MGTRDGGNRFPGVVAAPFAMTKLGPDVESGNTDAYSGYLSTGNISGFSMMHESGTGMMLELATLICLKPTSSRRSTEVRSGIPDACCR